MEMRFKIYNEANTGFVIKSKTKKECIEKAKKIIEEYIKTLKLKDIDSREIYN